MAAHDRRKAKNRKYQPELKSKIRFMPQTEPRALIKAFPKAKAKARFMPPPPLSPASYINIFTAAHSLFI
jgi:hypothetical protein